MSICRKWNEIDEDNIKFCTEVTKKQKEKGWSITELSKRTGIGVSKLYSITKMKVSLKFEDVLRLSKVLDISLDEIFNLN